MDVELVSTDKPKATRRLKRRLSRLKTITKLLGNRLNNLSPAYAAPLSKGAPTLFLRKVAQAVE